MSKKSCPRCWWEMISCFFFADGTKLLLRFSHLSTQPEGPITKATTSNMTLMMVQNVYRFNIEHHWQSSWYSQIHSFTSCWRVKDEFSSLLNSQQPTRLWILLFPRFLILYYLSLPWCSLLYCRAQMNFSSIACLVSRYCVFSSHFVMKFRCQFRLCNLVVTNENLRVSTVFIWRLKFNLRTRIESILCQLSLSTKVAKTGQKNSCWYRKTR